MRFPITCPDVLLTVAEPPSERVFELVLMFPLVRVSVPATGTSPPRDMPFDRFIVRLLSVTAGRAVLAPEPPKVMLDVPPPVRVPLLVEMSPLIVKVFAPIESAPLVRVNVPLTVAPEVRVTPALLLIVKLFTVAGRPLPVLCAELPL